MTHEQAVALAIDVGGTTIKHAIVGAGGQVHQLGRQPTGAGRGPDAVVATIVDIAADLAQQAHRQGLTPIGVGVVVPAVVRDGMAVWSANLGLRDVPLRAMVAERVGLPTALGHDVRAAALAEARLGGRQRPAQLPLGADDGGLLFVAIGTGIGGGYVLDRRVDDGSHGGAGEIGHIVVRTGPDARPCTCGGRGCLETYASATAIARTYATLTRVPAQRTALVDTALPAGPAGAFPAEGATRPTAGGGTPLAPGGATLPAAGGTTSRGVAELVAAGDPVAQQVWAEAIDALADGLLTAVALLDPAVIVLGGGVAEADETLLGPLRAALNRRRTFHRLPEVRGAALGDEAGCLGAALLALDLAGAA